mmetsp:Transcript_3512/g.13440  ORF Transcript_3512/g.13440 Transcript_3512/m.13440 type:complete len:654 (-) Transcript_3512:1235-3196(-)
MSSQLLKSFLTSHSVTHPSKLTINQLKSALSEAGVRLPESQRQKKDYVELYQNAMRRNSNDNNNDTGFQHQARQRVVPGGPSMTQNPPTTGSGGRKRKRHSEVPLRDEFPSKLVRGGMDANPFQKRKRKKRKASDEVDGNTATHVQHVRTARASVAVPGNDVDVIRDVSTLKSPQERDEAQHLNPFQLPSTVANGNVRTMRVPRGAAVRGKPVGQHHQRRISDAATAITDDLSSISSSNSDQITIDGVRPTVPPRRATANSTAPAQPFVSKELFANNLSHRRTSQKPVSHKTPSPQPSDTKKYTAPTFVKFPPQKQRNSMARISEKSQSACAVLVNILLGLLVLLFIGAVTFGAYKYYEQNRMHNLEQNRRPGEGLLYCTSEMDGFPQNECVPCPEHGYCASGDFIQCEPGYIWNNGLCVENEQITQEAVSIIEQLKPRLARHRGKFECGYEGLSNKGIPMKEIREEQQKEYVIHRQMPQEEFDAVFRKFKDLLEDYQFELTKAFISDEEKEVTGYSTDENNLMVYSEHISKPITCALREFYEQHRIYFIGFFAVLLSAMTLRVWLAKKQTQRLFYEEIKKTVLQRLRKEKQCVVVHLRDELKEHYKIDDKVWAHVVDRVQSDSRILEDVDPYNTELWIWNSDLKSEDNAKED